MKILFIGDYSNLHASLARQLRSEGHHVDVMSDGGGYMNTATDIFIERKKGLLGGFRYLYDLFTLLPDLSGYDVVQLINANFLSLKPGRIKYFFDRIKDRNGSIFLSLAGNDYYFVKACHDAKIFRFSEFKVGDKPTEFHETTPQRMYGWISHVNRDWSRYLYEKIDGAMSVLPEYDMAAKDVLGERLTFTNLPIDTMQHEFRDLPEEGPLRLFVGMREEMKIQKGTRYLLSVANDLKKEMPEKFEVECVKNLPLTEYLQRMRNADIVLDQYYSYSPGMNALYAMATGRVAATGGQPEYYEYLGKDYGHPILTLSPLEPPLRETLTALADNREKLIEMSRNGRKLVEEQNDIKKVTSRFINHWERFAR